MRALEKYNVDEIESVELYSHTELFENLIMNVEEVAKFLQVSTKTVYRNISEIPHRRVGKQYKFLLPELVNWFKKEGGHNDQF